jgi:hypothetical protein
LGGEWIGSVRPLPVEIGFRRWPPPDGLDSTGDVSLSYRLTCQPETFERACALPSGFVQVSESAGQQPIFVLRNAHVLHLPCGVRVRATLVVVGFFGRRQRGEGSSEFSKFYGDRFRYAALANPSKAPHRELARGEVEEEGFTRRAAPTAASVARGVGGIVRRSQLPCGGRARCWATPPSGETARR